MYRTKAIYQLSDLKQSSWKILQLFEIYRQSGSQAPVQKFYSSNFFVPGTIVPGTEIFTVQKYKSVIISF